MEPTLELTSRTDLLPAASVLEDIGARTDTGVLAPSGEKIAGAFGVGKNGVVLRIEDSVMPGLHKVDIPPSMQGALAGFADADGKLLFYVLPDPHESILTPLTENEVEWFHRHIDLLPAASLDDMLLAVKGQGFGKELWRTLALAMFILLVLEIALTRWIAMQRKTGEEGRVVFDEAMQPSVSFREHVAKMTGRVE